MSQFAAVLSRKGYEAVRVQGNTHRVVAVPDSVQADVVTDEVLQSAEALMLNIPAFDWSIEVDLLGRQRITIHFKGAAIEISETELG